MIKKNREQVFRDPIYGYINVEYDFITDIIDTQVFQRLRRIKQLSGVQMVYHGAEHSRFSHSLGVYRNAYKFLTVPDINNSLSERERLLFITTALLHDIGHGPYSHAFEDVFGVNHEEIGASIIVNNNELRLILDGIDKDFADDIASIIIKKGKFPILEQLISSQLDVDRLDYLLRDAYFTGTSYGNIDIDRLIRVTRVVNGQVVFKVSGIHAIENYLISRYHMYWQVYYHNVSRAYEVILEKAYLRIKDLLKQGFKFKSDITPLERVMKNKNDLEAFVLVDDFYINGLLSSFLNGEDMILKMLSSDFLNRNVWNYLDDTKENKNKINDIKKLMTEEECKYFTTSRSVFETTYKDNTEKIGDKIYILLEDGTISTLIKESKIIESIAVSGSKSDPKFFYRVLK
ncbi:MAG: HD domain-containing protein [Acholeplasma sp.]|nr:HD domain-containing protein [Acholeplasma sp.]